jgi:Leu/Phe-tRNA-protein transferase
VLCGDSATLVTARGHQLRMISADHIVGITRHLSLDRELEAYAHGVFPMAVPEARAVT